MEHFRLPFFRGMVLTLKKPIKFKQLAHMAAFTSVLLC